MPLKLDDVKLRLAFGTPRPYAAELGIDFNEVLSPEGLAALILAERLEAFFEPAQVMNIMRWMSGFLGDLDIKRSTPPEVITVLDYRWVVSLGRPLVAWDTKENEVVSIKKLAADMPPPEVSIAISLFAIWQRQICYLHNQTVDPA